MVAALSCTTTLEALCCSTITAGALCSTSIVSCMTCTGWLTSLWMIGCLMISSVTTGAAC